MFRELHPIATSDRALASRLTHGHSSSYKVKDRAKHAFPCSKTGQTHSSTFYPGPDPSAVASCQPVRCTQERRNKLLRRLEKLDLQQRRLERHLSDAAAIAAVANTAPRLRAVAAPDRGPGLSGGAGT